MPIDTFAAYKTLVDVPHQTLPFAFSVGGNTAARWNDAWMNSPPVPAAAPTTAEAPTSATIGAMNFTNGAGAAVLGLIGASVSAAMPTTVLLYDRLSHQGGLSGVTTGAQTTNLPTAALTRYTSGVGVMMALIINTSIGTTATTVTATYTDSAGTTGRVSPAVPFGSDPRFAYRAVHLPLQVGDNGVRSVQSVTIAATTGTAGAFGVLLYKPLAVMCVGDPSGGPPLDLVTGGFFGLSEVVDDACLSMMYQPGLTTAGSAAGVLKLAEW